MEPKPASMLEHLNHTNYEVKLSDINPSIKDSSKVDNGEPNKENTQDLPALAATVNSSLN